MCICWWMNCVNIRMHGATIKIIITFALIGTLVRGSHILCSCPLIYIISHAYLNAILFVSCIALFSLRFILLFDKMEIVATACNFAKARKNRAIYLYACFQNFEQKQWHTRRIYMLSPFWIYLSRKSLLNPIKLLAIVHVLWFSNPSEVHIFKFDWSRQTGTLRRGVWSVNPAWQQTSCYVADCIMMSLPLSYLGWHTAVKVQNVGFPQHRKQYCYMTLTNA